jgi:hypothetical protein
MIYNFESGPTALGNYKPRFLSSFIKPFESIFEKNPKILNLENDSANCLTIILSHIIN